MVPHVVTRCFMVPRVVTRCFMVPRVVTHCFMVSVVCSFSILPCSHMALTFVCPHDLIALAVGLQYTQYIAVFFTNIPQIGRAHV